MRIRRNSLVGAILTPVCILGSLLSFAEPNAMMLFALYLSHYSCVLSDDFDASRHYIVLLCGFYTQTIIERGFRTIFMVKKVIAFNEHHQRLAQQRARVLLCNILPHEVIPRYCFNLTSFVIVSYVLYYRLQKKGAKSVGTIVDYFEEATVMIVNISNLNEITFHLYPLLFLIFVLIPQ